MIKLTEDNYFSKEAMQEYWSVSSFKQFDKCEACALAEMEGEYQREETTSLLVGSYVDTYFAGPETMAAFTEEHPQIFNSRTGELKADYRKADELIARIERDPLMMEYMTGLKQVIMAAELFDVPWKIKIDVHGGDKIVDLKVVKDFEPLYKDGFGRVSWIEYWGYDIQGAIYQKIEQIYSGRVEPLPFYIVAVTKEKVPDIAVVQIPQHVLDTALKIVESKIDRFDLVKHGEIKPERCGKCDYCKASKVLKVPEVYEIEEA